MPRAWWHTNQHGISLVEVLLAITVFGMIVTAVGGSIMYGRTSTNASGNRQRATMLAEEGLEAVRNIRDNSFSNLTDGTYGLSQSASQWALTGTSDSNNGFTRQITISSNGTNRKDVSSKVSWQQGGQSGTSDTTITTRLTNWFASIIKSWTKPGIDSSADISGTNDAVKVDVVGNYAYVVRNDGTPDFVIYDISTPSSPTVVGSLSLNGVPTNVYVSGNYAYVTNTDDNAELNIINISNPATPSLVGNYNAAGAADGRGVYVVGNYAYLTRAANGGNNEFVILNVATPSAPIRVSGYNLNVDMNEVYVNGTVAYIATSSDTQEVLVINLSVLSLLTLGTSINLPGTTDATTIAGVGNNVIVGQGNNFYTLSLLLALIPVVSGNVTLSNPINDVDLNPSLTWAWAGTTGTANQLQVINISNFASPALAGTASISSTSSILSGVSYATSVDRVAGATSLDTQEFMVFSPN
jgi:hypothetical protein